MPGSHHTGAVQHITLRARNGLEGYRDSGVIHEERALVLRGCGGIGSTWVGRHRVDIGSPGSMGLRVVFSDRYSSSVSRLGPLGLLSARSSLALGSSSIGSANSVDAWLPRPGEFISARTDDERCACSPPYSRCPVWCISQPEGAMRKSNF